ncbi:MAG: Fic family protein [bacterium]|nr:Fic family protein [bacterium]
MIKLTPKQQKIIAIFLKKGVAHSSDVHTEIVKSGESISLITVKRTLSKLAEAGILIATGSGRSAGYIISAIGRIFSEVDANAYCSIEPDKRYGFNRYNFDLLPAFSPDLFTEDELKILNGATAGYKIRTKQLSATIQKKELERLIIELSWKSSKIEGNTYTLLDTEKLILENKEALGHSRKEAQMILNHKDAFNFIRANAEQFKTITRKNLEKLHAILVKNLTVDLGLREKPVGVVGSIYRPLDNIYQIAEAVDALSAAVSRAATPYNKALIALLGIGYVQPFEDGNKRTSRLMANAILLAYGLAPLSYRSIDENEYREAMLVFYELNSAMPFKKIFIGQYNFAAQNYAVK